MTKPTENEYLEAGLAYQAKTLPKANFDNTDQILKNKREREARQEKTRIKYKK